MGRIPGAGAAKTGCPVECVCRTQKRPHKYSHKREIPTTTVRQYVILRWISKIASKGTQRCATIVR